MWFARRWLVGLLVTGCGGHGTASDWVEVDLKGTDDEWFMYPDRCYASGPNMVELEEDRYAGARLAVEVDPHIGARVGITIPDEPISLWLGEHDGCETFEVALTPGDDGVTVDVELECELAWIGVWTRVQLSSCQ
jgi:hypothetical protein